MKLDELVDIVDAAYPDGYVRLYYDDPEGEHGDTLAKFIAVELKDTYDEDASTADQLEEAGRVMAVACDQLQGVIAALENWEMK